MRPVGVHLIFGEREEPFLEAALWSVGWADYVCAVNTAPVGSEVGAVNEAVVRGVVSGDGLRLARVPMRRADFDFAAARNAALALADVGDWVLVLDADDVHWPELEAAVRRYERAGVDVMTVHFFHLAVCKDLLHSVRHREIVFTNEPGVRFDRGVHELLVHPRRRPAIVSGYQYEHLGYIKDPVEVADRWEMYRDLGATVHDYDRSAPERALDAWVGICTPHWRAHPPAVAPLLAGYPSGVHLLRGEGTIGPPRVGLVMLTWDDAEGLAAALPSLATTYEPFDLFVVDNGSEDGSEKLVAAQFPDATVMRRPGLSLAEALNVGFGAALAGGYDYVGWVHPDMVFDWPDWLGTLVSEMDSHPEWAKLGAQESSDGNRELRAGNSQCYVVRRSALKGAGLFDERFRGCGGYEDWEMNSRLLRFGAVMITPSANVHHFSMGTRRRHDNDAAARFNSGLFHELTGSWDPPV